MQSEHHNFRFKTGNLDLQDTKHVLLVCLVVCRQEKCVRRRSFTRSLAEREELVPEHSTSKSELLLLYVGGHDCPQLERIVWGRSGTEQIA